MRNYIFLGQFLKRFLSFPQINEDFIYFFKFFLDVVHLPVTFKGVETFGMRSERQLKVIW